MIIILIFSNEFICIIKIILCDFNKFQNLILNKSKRFLENTIKLLNFIHRLLRGKSKYSSFGKPEICILT